MPDIVVLHRRHLPRKWKKQRLERIKHIREAFPNNKILIAVAGGIVSETAKEALEKGAYILIVGR